MRIWIFMLVFSSLGILGARAEEHLPRVVSLDSCADQFVLALAKPEQIVALSRNASLPFSYFQDEAEHFPSHNGSAEEILMLKPDIAVRTAQGDFDLAEMLERQGIPVTVAGLPSEFSQMREDILVFGKALGREQAAWALLEEFDRRMKEINLWEWEEGPLAIYMSPGGATSGPGTFIDQVLRLAGLRNQMGELGMHGWGTIDLEVLVMNPPEVVIGSFFDARIGSSDNWRLGNHPVAKKIFENAKFIEVPSRLLGCPAWYALDAVDLIRKEMK